MNDTQKSTRPRGAVTKNQGRKLISLWIPSALHKKLEEAVQLQDSDKSKVVRDALRQHLRRTA
jgi:metal-responsive CopG/Arc/MetJ family transcriptional regulator